MKINEKISFVIYILLIFISFLIILTNLIYAEDITASQYKLNFILNYPQKVISDPVEINRTSLETDKKNENQNIYLDSFILKNSKGKEIPEHYIILETPFLQKQETLDKQHRFLILRNNQDKSWFRIGLAKETGFIEPGEYTGILNIDDLDWEIKVKAVIKPFVSFSIEENTFEFEIIEPFANEFFITDDFYQMNVDYNHSNWEVKAHVEGFINEQGEKLDPEYLYYHLERTDISTDINKLKKDEFSNFKEDEMNIMINGRDYDRGLTAIRFGVNLARDNVDVQPAGFYKGKIIFTLRILNNNL